VAKYYINKNAQDNGDHEVHKEGCSHMPHMENCIFLGHFSHCRGAVEAGKKYYATSSGFFFVQESVILDNN